MTTMAVGTRRRTTVKTSDVVLAITFIGVFRPYLLPDNLVAAMRIAFLGLSLIFLVSHMKLKRLVNASLFFSGAVLLSCVKNYVTHKLSMQNLLNGILYAICLYCLYTIIQYFVQKGRGRDLVSNLYHIVLVYVIISIPFIIFLPPRGAIYPFGSKYFTSYYMMALGAIYMLRHRRSLAAERRHRRLFLLVAAILFVLIWYINCRTAAVAFAAMIAMNYLPDGLKRKMMNHWVMLALTLGSAAILLGLSAILEISAVQFVITRILGKDLTLTDRVRYYSRFTSVLTSGDMWFGYGYASSELRNAIGLGSNIQNGLLQHTLSYGAIGALAFVMTVFLSGRPNVNRQTDCWALYTLVYGMTIAAVVEISFNTVYFLGLFLVMWSYHGTDGIESNYAARELT
ncbi:MAG: hypothetical protein IKP40_01320 [Clostridia bacterium]|nr:hypothetical protein [Clostridia bacterium]